VALFLQRAELSAQRKELRISTGMAERQADELEKSRHYQAQPLPIIEEFRLVSSEFKIEPTSNGDYSVYCPTSLVIHPKNPTGFPAIRLHYSIETDVPASHFRAFSEYLVSSSDPRTLRKDLHHVENWLSELDNDEGMKVHTKILYSNILGAIFLYEGKYVSELQWQHVNGGRDGFKQLVEFLTRKIGEIDVAKAIYQSHQSEGDDDQDPGTGFESTLANIQGQLNAHIRDTNKAISTVFIFNEFNKCTYYTLRLATETDIVSFRDMGYEVEQELEQYRKQHPQE